jgi:hypothetical protein
MLSDWSIKYVLYVPSDIPVTLKEMLTGTLAFILSSLNDKAAKLYVPPEFGRAMLGN